MTDTTMTAEKATALRRPFPEESVGKLPKSTCRECSQSQRKRCDRHTWVSTCPECHGSHSSATLHLDYVGHAATTDRLLTVDPSWSWEPFALGPDGLPATDRANNLWIRLTVCGVTRIGVGDGKSAKECIGDAIRNAAMRFGVALDLWAKEDLVEFAREARVAAAPAPAPAGEPDPAPTADTPPPTPITSKTRGQMFALFAQKGVTEELQLPGINRICETSYTSRSELTEPDAKRVIEALRQRPDVTATTETDAGPAEGEGEAPEPGPAEVTPAVSLPASRAMSKPQARMLAARLAELGVEPGDEQELLAIASAFLTREVTSTGLLSKTDADQLLDTLAPFRDRDALNAALDVLDAGGRS